MTVTDWLTAAASLGAVVVAVLAYVGSRRDAASAKDDARRAADAAEAAAAAQTKIAERFVPRWSLARRADTGTVLLLNENEEAAYDVRIDVAPWYFTEGSPKHPVIPAGSSVAFMVTTDEQADFDDKVRVTWHRRSDLSDERQVWEEPINWRLF